MANCSNCGAQLDGAKKFCTGCGQPVEQTPAQTAQPVQQAAAPAPQPVTQPPEKKKKSKAPIIIIIVVLLIAAIGAAAFFTNGFGLFGDKGGDPASTSDPTGGNSTPSSTTSTPGGSDPGNKELPLSNEWIGLEKTYFAPKEIMNVTIKGVTEQMLATADDACVGWFHITDTTNYSAMTDFRVVGENVCEFGAPEEPGEYEVRLFSKWGTDAPVISTLRFNVGNNPPSNNTQGGNDPTSNPGNDPTSTPGGNDPGEAIGYPAEWPSAIPKMNGTVKTSFAMAEKPQDGYQVIIGNKTIDEVMGYVDSLKSNGYAFNASKDVEVPFTNGTYSTTLRNGTYAVGISFTESTKDVAVYFLKDQ